MMNEYGLSSRMSSRLDTLPPSMSQPEEYPKDLIHLNVAENWLLRSELVEFYKNVVAENMSEETLSYPEGFGGDPTLRKTFASFFNTYFNPSIEVKAEHIVTISGSGNCLDALCCSICDDGDSVMMLGPAWFGFGLQMKFHANVDPIIVDSPSFRGNMSEDCISRLEAAFEASPRKSRIKALLICNPNNPTDECYSAEVLRGLMSFCHKKDLHFITDEIHAFCVFNSPSRPFVSALSLLDKEQGGEVLIKSSRVHVIYSMSKDFGSPGIRMACIVSQANRPLLNGVTISSFWQTSSLSTIYTIALLTSPELPNLIKLNSSRLLRSYKLITAALLEWDIEFLPSSAGVCLWVKIAKTAATWEEEAAMVKSLRDNGVLVFGGKLYNGINGEKGWIRMLFAVKEDVMREAIKRIGKTLGYIS